MSNAVKMTLIGIGSFITGYFVTDKFLGKSDEENNDTAAE